MTITRTNESINKAEDDGTAHGQIRSTDALRRVFPTTVASYLTSLAWFVRRQWGTGRANCRLADVLSSAARARRGGVHGQQCDIWGDFVAGSIWLLLQQRWFIEQRLCERKGSTNGQRKSLWTSTAGGKESDIRMGRGDRPGCVGDRGPDRLGRQRRGTAGGRFRNVTFAILGCNHSNAHASPDAIR